MCSCSYCRIVVHLRKGSLMLSLAADGGPVTCAGLDYLAPLFNLQQTRELAAHSTLRTSHSIASPPHTILRASSIKTRDYEFSGSKLRPSHRSKPAHDSDSLHRAASPSLFDTLPLRWLPAAAVSVSDRSGSTPRKTPQADHHRTGRRT
jgi:hypothetical protein